MTKGESKRNCEEWNATKRGGLKMRNQNRLSDKEVSLSIDILESVLNWYKGLSAVRKLNAKQEKYLGGNDGKIN